MAGKQHTIEETKECIKAMCGKTLADCYLHVGREWGRYAYSLVFTEDDVKDRLEFDRIEDVWQWLGQFEERNS